MSTTENVQAAASILLAVGGGGAILAYFKDRRKAKAEGLVASATVEIQVEAARVQNLEQQFGFARQAWSEERASFERRIMHIEEELADERRERSEEKVAHEEKVGLLETRVRGMQNELSELTDELASLRSPSPETP